MAKLVDLLAKYLVEWPKRCEIIVQDEDKECNPCGCECADIKSNAVWIRDSPLGCNFYLDELASDWDTAKVTYKQWLAARDRLHAETLKEMIKVGGTLEAQEFDADQALWDKVAVAAVNGEMSCQSNAAKRLDAGDLVRYSFAVADAFMAERAKRLKGGV